MYGAGSIGRGFMGQLFSQSGFEVVFIDINSEIIEKLNELNSYPIRIAKNEGYYEIVVENVRGVNGKDIEKVKAEISSADIMATAVGVNVLSQIAVPIAKGLRERWKNKNYKSLNIIVCENKLKANLYLKKLVSEQLTEKEVEILDKTIGFVETSISRNVPVMNKEMYEDNPLRIFAEEYSILPLDKDSIKGDLPKIINIKKVSPFDSYLKGKLFIHNMAHAVSSYIGYQKGFKFLWEAWRVSSIKLITFQAMIEASLAMSLEHGFNLQDLINLTENITYRFSNRLLGITIKRLGKESFRKLSKNDRLIGPSELCLKHGIKPVYICIGVAAGFMFSNIDDPWTDKVNKLVSEEGIESAVEKVCELDSSNEIARTIIRFYSMLKDGICLEDIIEEAEKIKNEGLELKRL